MVDPPQSRTRLRAWRVIPPNHPAGAATGFLSMPGVCPDPRRTSSTCVPGLVRRQPVTGHRSRRKGPSTPDSLRPAIRLPLSACGTPDAC